MNAAHKLKGFSLLELVIVLLILGLLIAGILGPLSIRFEQKQRQETQEILEDIKESLIGFAITEGRLPCPDCRFGDVGSCNDSNVVLNDGQEDLIGAVGSQVCAADISGTLSAIGNIPWVDLGVRESDAWDRFFTYAVTSDFADETAGAADGTTATRVSPCGTATVGVSFELCSRGNLQINKDDEPSGITQVLSVDFIPALVFSGAENNFADQATPSPQESENIDNLFLILPDDNIFFSDDIIAVDNNQFDDLMIWISPNILKNRMVQAGRLP